MSGNQRLLKALLIPTGSWLINIPLMVYLHWLSPGPGQGPSPEPGRTFHTAPEQEQGSEQGQGRMGYEPIFQVLKLFQVVCFNDISMAFRCPVLAPDTASMNGFCIISVPVLSLSLPQSQRQPEWIHHESQRYLTSNSDLSPSNSTWNEDKSAKFEFDVNFTIEPSTVEKFEMYTYIL